MASAPDSVSREDFASEVASLSEEFRRVFSQETIKRYVSESIDRMAGARLNEFVSLLVHRFTRQRLMAAGQAHGQITKEVPEVLFVCVHNAGRSQMAAGLMRHLSAGRVHVRTAGSDPADAINPAVAQALREVGVDVSEEFPKPLTEEFVRAADVVITMGCGDACPVYPGKRYEDWELEDLAGKDVEAVRRIRDQIERRVTALLAELVAPPA